MNRRRRYERVSVEGTNIRLVIARDDDEWIVEWYDNGIYSESKTYYASDREDAVETMNRIQKKLESGGNLKGLGGKTMMTIVQIEVKYNNARQRKIYQQFLREVRRFGRVDHVDLTFGNLKIVLSFDDAVVVHASKGRLVIENGVPRKQQDRQVVEFEPLQAELEDGVLRVSTYTP